MKDIIYKEIEKFDIEFPDSRSIFEGGDPYRSRRKAIKNWIVQYTKRILEEQIKDWEEIKSNKEELELCKDIDIELFNRSELINKIFENRISKNKQIIKELGNK